MQSGTVRLKSIVYFEWIIFGGILLTVLQEYHPFGSNDRVGIRARPGS